MYIRTYDAITAGSNQADKTIADAKAEAEGILAVARDWGAQRMAKARAKADALAKEVDDAHAQLGSWSSEVQSRVLRMGSVREEAERMKLAFESLHNKIVAIVGESV